MRHALARLVARPRRAAVGAAALCAILLSLTVLLTDPPYVTGDEPPHMDYAYQVWHGELPVFEEGLEFRPDRAVLPPVQWTAQHPPLFYLLVSWLVGPLVDAGHPAAAVYAARAVNMLLAGVFVLACWWSASRICRPGSVLPQLVALVAGLAAAVAHAGGNAFNDLVATLCVTTMFGVGATAIRRGLDTRLVVLLSLLAAASALSRLSAALIAVVIGAFAVLAGSVRAAQGRGRWGPVLGLAIGGPATALAAAGWFYARNVALTGNIPGSHFDWALANQVREVRPVWQVALDPVTWARLPDFFWWAGRVPPTTPYSATTLTVTAILLVWAPLIIGLLVRVRRGGPWWSGWRPARPGATGRGTAGRRTTRGARPGAPDRPGAVAPRIAGGAPVADDAHPADRLLVALLPWAAVTTSVTAQVLYTAASGGMYPRYLLPVALPVFLAVAAGLAWRPRLLVPLWAAVAIGDLVSWLFAELTTPAQPGLYAEPTAIATAAGVLGVCGTLAATWATMRTLRAAGPENPGSAPAPVGAGVGVGAGRSRGSLENA
ncbi:hypothetical protein [Myceligenerans pegani]|uniref:Uncharacterized protein n=1 Tax=Myceligenerans pegani TaxID=2776917 RepID=A0ABR9N427_9MICO|nr:hypothetical protein [Myceligenerans sp. TRM 65318]MBE1878413.1 hypothetical protein [Myceligenerans sp. TRM 65318]MBE3020684.1 hypothetical protein [Myceligenerans sp. TRM 65318]